MTIETTTSKAGPYAGAGTAGPFPVPFRFLDASHLQVIRTDISGANTTLSIGSDYSVQGVGQTTGAVTLAAALAVGFKLTVLRSVPATQEADYVQNDAFPAESHERALDKLTMLVQQQGEAQSRALTVPPSDPLVSLELPSAANRSRRYLSFDDVGRPVSTTFDVDEVARQSQAAIDAAAAAKGSADDSADSALEAKGYADYVRDESALVGEKVNATTPNIVNFTGDGDTVEFLLPSNPGSKKNLIVSIDGVLQHQDAFDLPAGSTRLVFAEAPPATGANNIEVRIAPSVMLTVTDAQDMSFVGPDGVKRNVGEYLRDGVSKAVLISATLAQATDAAKTLPSGQGVIYGAANERVFCSVVAGELEFEGPLAGYVKPSDFGAIGDGVANDTACFEKLEGVISGVFIDLQGKSYKVDNDFLGNKYFNGVLVFSSIPVPGDVVLNNPHQKGIATSKKVSTALQTKSGLKLATINGAIQGAVIDDYSGVLHTLVNVSGDASTGSEVNKIVSYNWSGQNVAMSSIAETSGSLDIGHQSLGMEIVQSGTRSTQGGVRLWVTGGSSKGADASKFAVRFSTPGGDISDVEFFKLWGDDVQGGNRVLATCPYAGILVSTGIRGGQWFARVFDLATFSDGAGDYSAKYKTEFRTQNYNRSLQDAATDGEFIYFYHGGTAFSSTLKYIEVYSIDGTHISTQKVQAGALRAWEISEAGGDLLYEPEALLVTRGPFGTELIFVNTNGTPAGASSRETTFYTLRPNHNLLIKSASSSVAGISLDCVHDISIPKGGALGFSECDPSGALSTIFSVSKDGTSQSSSSGALTNSLASTAAENVSIRVSNSVRAGAFQVSPSGNIGFWDSTNSRYILNSSSLGNLTFNSVTNHAGNVLPLTDNLYALGNAAQRYTIVYSASGTINTSDAREKTPPQQIGDPILDAWGDVQIICFKWLSGIQEKGEASARWHFGVIAQQVRDAFLSRGIDGTKYGLLCYDEWDDEYEPVTALRDVERASEDGVVVTDKEEYETGEFRLVRVAGNRWGIRADQCLFLEAAYQRRRADRIEARLDAAGI